MGTAADVDMPFKKLESLEPDFISPLVDLSLDFLNMSYLTIGGLLMPLREVLWFLELSISIDFGIPVV